MDRSQKVWYTLSGLGKALKRPNGATPRIVSVDQGIAQALSRGKKDNPQDRNVARLWQLGLSAWLGRL